jgi:dipeptidyl aminopeptidase/acylaminoacyl peptidase
VDTCGFDSQMSVQPEYGFWPSPLSPEKLAAGSARLGSPRFAPDGSLYFVEQRSAEQGRGVLMRRTPAGQLEEALPAAFGVRSRVHEYGGLAYLPLTAAIVFVNQADQQLWIRRGDAEPRPLTAAPEWRFAEPLHDPRRRRVLAIGERHPPDKGAVENCLVSVALDGAPGLPTVLARGRDFYAAPALSPDGSRLAFLAWDHPHLPWDAAEVQVGQLTAAGELALLEQVAGGPEASAFQPTWSPGGVLYFALERDGYWNLHRQQAGHVALVAAQDAELGAPLWQLGTQVFAFESEHSVVGACFERGLSKLVRFDLERGEVAELSDALTQVGELAWHAGELACLSGWAGGGSELITLDPSRPQALTPVRQAYAGWLTPAESAKPEAISFPTSDGDTAHGIFYAPVGGPAGSGARPPLMVLVHGGPTACAPTVWRPDIQFWTSRGFAVLDVNYRGSSGFGRAYRDRLRGGWGVLDVDDCVFGARYLADGGRVAARELFIRGGSAGGYTVLQALANHMLFAGGSCHYGISDLEALVRDTHKFESHYDRFLIGPYPERRDLFIERSPIYAVDRIRTPVAFFQGLEDKVVPPNQTEHMAETLRARGVECEYHGYPGEQHGFRQASTIRAVLTAELAFFQARLAHLRHG